MIFVGSKNRNGAVVYAKRSITVRIVIIILILEKSSGTCPALTESLPEDQATTIPETTTELTTTRRSSSPTGKSIRPSLETTRPLCEATKHTERTHSPPPPISDYPMNIARPTERTKCPSLAPIPTEDCCTPSTLSESRKFSRSSEPIRPAGRPNQAPTQCPSLPPNSYHQHEVPQVNPAYPAPADYPVWKEQEEPRMNPAYGAPPPSMGNAEHPGWEGHEKALVNPVAGAAQPSGGIADDPDSQRGKISRPWLVPVLGSSGWGEEETKPTAAAAAARVDPKEEEEEERLPEFEEGQQSPEHWAWLVSTGRNNPPVLAERHFCVGSLVAADAVLTAGRCVGRLGPEQLAVRLGSRRMCCSGSLRLVERVLLHDGPVGAALLKLVAQGPAAAAGPAALASLPGGLVVGAGLDGLGWCSGPGGGPAWVRPVHLAVADYAECAPGPPPESSFCSSASEDCHVIVGSPLTRGDVLVGLAAVEVAGGAAHAGRRLQIDLDVASVRRWIVAQRNRWRNERDARSCGLQRACSLLLSLLPLCQLALALRVL